MPHPPANKKNKPSIDHNPREEKTFPDWTNLITHKAVVGNVINEKKQALAN
jgi:hypothetical protein